ncbi:MAG: DUF3108 domain-containing protein [Ignavibacteriales bacterium]|nr:DUF3108 domain-containing protein [Ignavibacteriales bacterium]
MNASTRALVVVTILLACVSGSLFGQRNDRGPFIPGEVLRFKVRWGFIRLGSIVLKQAIENQKDTSQHVITLSGESSPLLKIIDAAFNNRAIVSPRSLVSYEYTSEIGRKKHLKISQKLHRRSGAMDVLEVRDGKQVVKTRIEGGASLFNDLSFLMYVRTHAGSGREVLLPSIYKDSVITTRVNLSKEITRLSLAPFPQPVRAYPFEARANWTNQEIAGFKGEFRGYVSAEPGAMLLKLEAKVLIGSIVLELESFENPSLARPTAR